MGIGHVRRAAALAVAALAAGVGVQPAWASLTPFQQVIQQGDYVAAGTGMRGTGAGVIAIAIPPGSTVTNAYLYWAILGRTDEADFSEGNFDGNFIDAGAPIATSADPCWQESTGGETGVTTTFVYRADVTAYVTAADPSYALTGFASDTTPLTPSLAEGATLVVLYANAELHPETRAVVIYEGADLIDTDNNMFEVSTPLQFPAISGSATAKTTYVVADGQLFVLPDETRFVGSAGTMIVENALDGSDGDFWDTDLTQDGYDVSAFVQAGDTTATVELFGLDCVVHVAQVFSAPAVVAAEPEPEPAFLTLDPPAATPEVDSEHTVTATVESADLEPVPDAVVRFTVMGAVNTTGECTTQAPDGQCDFTFQGPALPGPVTIDAFVDVDEDMVQDPGEPTAAATALFVLPASTANCEVKVTYGGWIVALNMDRANFGGNAKTDNDGNVSGQEEFQDQGPAQPMNLHGDPLAVVCPWDGTATIFGEGTIDGAGNHKFRIDLKDLGEPGTGVDHYRMRIETNAYDTGEQTLRGGNVQIHKLV